MRCRCRRCLRLFTLKGFLQAVCVLDARMALSFGVVCGRLGAFGVRLHEIGASPTGEKSLDDVMRPQQHEVALSLVNTDCLLALCKGPGNQVLRVCCKVQEFEGNRKWLHSRPIPSYGQTNTLGCATAVSFLLVGKQKHPDVVVMFSVHRSFLAAELQPSKEFHRHKMVVS